MAKEDLQRRTDQQNAIVIPTVGPPGTAASNPTSLLGTPALVFGTANIAGTSSLGIATNATIAIFDTTLPAATTLTAVVGTALFAAHRDHVHAIDQSIAPTWSAVHTYTATPQFANNIKLKVTASVNYLTLTPSADAAVTVTVPAVTDTLVNLSSNQTLSGQKTFSNATAPIISALIGPASTQQHTIPAVASDTIALLAATQTLTNKTLSGGTITGTIAGSPTLTGTWTFTNTTNAISFKGDNQILQWVDGSSVERGKAQFVAAGGLNAINILTVGDAANTDGEILLGVDNSALSRRGRLRFTTASTLYAALYSVTGTLSGLTIGTNASPNAILDVRGSGIFTGGLNVGTATGAATGEARASSGLRLSGVTLGQLQMRNLSIADLGVAQLLNSTGSGTDTMTMLLILDTSSGMCAIYYTLAGRQSTQEVSDPDAVFTPTAGTASSTNIYWSAGNARYEIENRRGATRNYDILIWSGN